MDQPSPSARDLGRACELLRSSFSNFLKNAPRLTRPRAHQLRQRPLPRKKDVGRGLHLRVPASRHAHRVRVQPRLRHQCALPLLPLRLRDPSLTSYLCPLPVSAGYDAAQGDNLGQMQVTPAGFAHMTHMLSVLANGKMVMALEVRPASPPSFFLFLLTFFNSTGRLRR